MVSLVRRQVSSLVSIKALFITMSITMSFPSYPYKHIIFTKKGRHRLPIASLLSHGDQQTMLSFSIIISVCTYVPTITTTGMPI